MCGYGDRITTLPGIPWDCAWYVRDLLDHNAPGTLFYDWDGCNLEVGASIGALCVLNGQADPYWTLGLPADHVVTVGSVWEAGITSIHVDLEFSPPRSVTSTWYLWISIGGLALGLDCGGDCVTTYITPTTTLTAGGHVNAVIPFPAAYDAGTTSIDVVLYCTSGCGSGSPYTGILADTYKDCGTVGCFDAALGDGRVAEIYGDDDVADVSSYKVCRPDMGDAPATYHAGCWQGDTVYVSDYCGQSSNCGGGVGQQGTCILLPFSHDCTKSAITPASVPVCVGVTDVLNVSGWLAYLACIQEATAASVNNVAVSMVNGLLDLLVPGQALQDMLSQFATGVQGHAPFTWFAGIADALSSAMSASPTSLCSVFPDVSLGGGNIDTCASATTALEALAPWRTFIYGGFVLLWFVRALGAVMGSVGMRGGASDGD
jgi:hypothetical protein